jgi:hypothetical protein
MSVALLPPLRGLVLSSDRTDVLIVSLSGDGTSEATLKLDKKLKHSFPAGRAVAFSGVARALTQTPFMLSFDVKIRQLSVVS